ncbi:MAG: CerR family C-terminal domain-containing protein [Pseudomonadota bacterium]|nr:CerR family C-terminal domain-containing protein [Pseudomonadota bacterium]
MPDTHSSDSIAHDPRTQLILAAAQVFSRKGFDAASTREICQTADMNLSSIKYYFGDKAGLYREVLRWAFSTVTESFGDFDAVDLSFEQAMQQFLAPLLQQSVDTQQADLDAQVMRLYLYEMIKPSSVFPDIIQQTVAPVHQSFCRLLARQVGAPTIDPEIHQLAFAIGAMAHDYYMSRDFMLALAPEVLLRPDATAQTIARLIAYSQALLHCERQRRQVNSD